MSYSPNTQDPVPTAFQNFLNQDWCKTTAVSKPALWFLPDSMKYGQWGFGAKRFVNTNEIDAQIAASVAGYFAVAVSNIAADSGALGRLICHFEVKLYSMRPPEGTELEGTYYEAATMTTIPYGQDV